MWPYPQFYDIVQIFELILILVLLPNLSNILESVLVLILVILQLKLLILKSHILLWENKYGLEFQFLDLVSLTEQISTPELLLDLS